MVLEEFAKIDFPEDFFFESSANGHGLYGLTSKNTGKLCIFSRPYSSKLTDQNVKVVSIIFITG